MVSCADRPWHLAPGEGKRMAQFDERFGRDVLDCAHDLLLQGEVDRAMTSLFAALHQLRRSTCGEQWERYCIACRAHPICALLHQDPLTAHSFAKPYGYAPDATITAFVHGENQVPDQLGAATPLGQEIHRWILQHPMS